MIASLFICSVLAAHLQSAIAAPLQHEHAVCEEGWGCIVHNTCYTHHPSTGQLATKEACKEYSGQWAQGRDDYYHADLMQRSNRSLLGGRSVDHTAQDKIFTPRPTQYPTGYPTTKYPTGYPTTKKLTKKLTPALEPALQPAPILQPAAAAGADQSEPALQPAPILQPAAAAGADQSTTPPKTMTVKVTVGPEKSLLETSDVGNHVAQIKIPDSFPVECDPDPCSITMMGVVTQLYFLAGKANSVSISQPDEKDNTFIVKFEYSAGVEVPTVDEDEVAGKLEEKFEGVSVLSVGVADNEDAAHSLAIQAKAEGDPHIVNLAGEKFDITVTGVYEAVHIPRGSHDSDVQLSIQIHVIATRMRQCRSLFFTRTVKVTGQLMGSAESLSIEADQSFHMQLGPKKIAFTQGKLWSFLDEPVTLPGWPQSDGITTVMKSMKSFNGRPSYQLTMGSVRLHVERIAGGSSYYLNLRVNGLSKLRQSIGGILGFDNHDDLVVGSDACKGAELVQQKSWIHSGSDLVAEN